MRIGTCVSLFALTALPLCSRANLISNGSFETPVLQGGSNHIYQSGEFIGPTGGGPSDGWTVSASIGADLYSVGFGYPNAIDGNQALYLGENGLNGGVSQLVNLGTGQHNLSFLQASISFPSRVSLHILGPVGFQFDQYFDWSGSWTQQQTSFTTTQSGLYTLWLIQPSGFTSVVDDVDLVAVPAPSVLGALGFSAFTFSLRRRR